MVNADTATAARRAAIVQRIEREIDRDVRDGVLPEGPLTFSDLHDYLDATLYGGLCDDSITGNADIDAGDLILIQDAVEGWLLSDARNVPKDRPLLGVARYVKARELAAGHWVCGAPRSTRHGRAGTGSSTWRGDRRAAATVSDSIGLTRCGNGWPTTIGCPRRAGNTFGNRTRIPRIDGETL